MELHFDLIIRKDFVLDIWILTIFLFYKYPDGDLCFILVRLSKDIKNEDQMQNVK